MTNNTPEPLRPGYYLCMSPAGIPHLRAYGHDIWCDNEGQIRKDPRTLGYTIHYLPDLLELGDKVARLEWALSEASKIIRDAKRKIAPNTTNSTVDDWIARFATPQGEEGAG